MTIKIGDWIRFYQNGRLVIGVVQYVGRNWEGDFADTDVGRVAFRNVKEVRSGAEA